MQLQLNDGTIVEVINGVFEYNGKQYDAQAMIQLGKARPVNQAQQSASSMQPQRQPRPVQQPSSSSGQMQPSSSSSKGMLSDFNFAEQIRPQMQQFHDELVGPNPAMTMLSLAFPLTVDELETDGFTGDLGWKLPVDLGMNLFSPVKAAGLGVRAGGAFLRRGAQVAPNALDNLGMRILNPWTSMNAGHRIGGQAGANAVDNMIATGMSAALDNREHDNLLGEFGISAGLGGALGSLNGLRSYAKSFDFMEQMQKNVRPRYTTKGEPTPKTRQFDMLNRFDDVDFSNAEKVTDIVNSMPPNATFPYLPSSYSQIDDRFRAAIAEKNAEVDRIRQNLNNQNFINEGNQLLTRDQHFFRGTPRNGMPQFEITRFDIEEPIFQNAQERQRFYRDINNFLETNNLGAVIDNQVALYENVNPMQVESVLSQMRGNKIPTKGQQDYREQLRIAMRNARGGDVTPPGQRTRFGEIMQPTNDIGIAMNDLEKLHRQRAIMNIAAGNERGSPDFLGVPSVNPRTRPQLGTADLAPNARNVPQRAVTQGVANTYDRKDEISNHVDKWIVKPKETAQDILNYQQRLEELKRKAAEAQ